MGIVIELPKVSEEWEGRAHHYPIQIGYQTQEFLQGSIFHAAYIDVAASQYTQMPGAFERIKSEFVDKDMDESTWQLSWSCLRKYEGVFREALYQNVLIAMKSHWDWYISKLGQFVAFAIKHSGGQGLDRDLSESLRRVAFREMSEQLRVLEQVSGLNFEIQDTTIGSLKEMALVRNLGIHNRWEVNGYYRKHSRNKSWSVGELRTITVQELEEWHSSLLEGINSTSVPIGERYVSAPAYQGL